ncbi:MAG TPA: hypothetical protein VE621_14970 [Bryobacteraceae bacterium]|nr:hypothetical protein [Bryobacteraceae bacterium]
MEFPIVPGHFIRRASAEPSYIVFHGEASTYYPIVIRTFLLTPVTHTVLAPWATIERAEFLAHHLSIEGDIPLESIERHDRAATATGEGLSSLLEIDGAGL